MTIEDYFSLRDRISAKAKRLGVLKSAVELALYIGRNPGLGPTEISEKTGSALRTVIVNYTSLVNGGLAIRNGRGDYRLSGLGNQQFRDILES